MIKCTRRKYKNFFLNNQWKRKMQTTRKIIELFVLKMSIEEDRRKVASFDVLLICRAEKKTDCTKKFGK